MRIRQRTGSGVAVGSMGACGVLLALGLSSACGSSDSARKDQNELPAGAGGQEESGAAGQGPASGGTPSSTGGTGGTPGSPGGAGAGGDGHAAGGVDGGSAGAGDGGAAGAKSDGGASGDGGAPAQACESLEPAALQGVWATSCNGYNCAMYITTAGDFANGCSNGQYEAGTIADGKLDTLGEGGLFPPYSTKGTLTRTACDSVTRAYIGQTPPNTGPEVSYSCVLTRAPACAPSLIQALAGVWNGSCGNSSCVTTITAQGAMSSTCSNGQQSTGMVEETGRFSDEGSGGSSPAYSTSGVIGLTSCNSFIMPYTWQIPAHTGAKTSAKCTYTRQQDQ